MLTGVAGLDVPGFFPRQKPDRLLVMSYVHVRVAQNHLFAPPPAQLHESDKIAVGGIVPRRPGMATIMGGEIRDAGSAAGALKGSLDWAAAIGPVLVGLSVRAAENRTRSIPQRRQLVKDARMQRDPPCIPIFGLEKLHL